MFIWSYRKGSKSVRALRDAIPEMKMIRRENSAFVGGPDKTVVNWGGTKLPYEAMCCNVLNHPKRVQVASDKIKAFLAMEVEELGVPFTTDPLHALDWHARGWTVYARTKTRAMGGKGIIVVRPEDDWVPEAPLYTMGIQSDGEYRVHVWEGEIIGLHKKGRKDGDRPNADQSAVRNHDNGWIFLRDFNIDPDVEDDITRVAAWALEALKLDFGAVDLIWSENDNRPYVLEVNTAPGLEGQTIDAYAEKIREL